MNEFIISYLDKISSKENIYKPIARYSLSSIYTVENKINRPPKDSPWNEMTCSAPSLRGHIVNAHFDPDILARLGIPRFDIELAQFRGFDLNWVAKKVYERLEEPTKTTAIRFRLLRKFHNTCVDGRDPYFAFGDVAGYRRMLVRSLMYIEQLGLAPINWDRVRQAVPALDEINLDLERDSSEGPFITRGHHLNSFSGTSLAFTRSA